MVKNEMFVEEFDYDLPEELIAQTPLSSRPSSRLLVLDKKSGEVKHKHFYDILDLLNPGDCLCLNDTRVIPARLFGAREDTGSAVEFLLLEQKENDVWDVIVRPGKKCRPGHKIVFGNGQLKAEILEITDGGNRLVKFLYEGIFNEVLSELGEMPLPPYIHEKLEDKDRYQTVYAKHDGSAAAPTAGLHFNDEMLEAVKKKGIHLAFVTLHVGLGTFRPVKVDKVTDHLMHSEYYQISEETAQIINETKKNGGRIICVGTTSTRVIESVAREDGTVAAGSGYTNIFIYPGYRFKCLDCLITNFHLPKSTLIMLVSALAGKENVLAAYKTAVEERYRFFSFGDAMFIQ